MRLFDLRFWVCDPHMAFEVCLNIKEHRTE